MHVASAVPNASRNSSANSRSKKPRKAITAGTLKPKPSASLPSRFRGRKSAMTMAARQTVAPQGVARQAMAVQTPAAKNPTAASRNSSPGCLTTAAAKLAASSPSKSGPTNAPPANTPGNQLLFHLRVVSKAISIRGEGITFPNECLIHRSDIFSSYRPQFILTSSPSNHPEKEWHHDRSLDTR